MHSSLPILRIHYLVLNFPMIGGCYDLGYIDPMQGYNTPSFDAQKIRGIILN